MATLSIGTQNFSPLSEASADPATVGWYFAMPPVGPVPSEGEAEYDLMPIHIPGVDGMGTKNMGFVGRDIDAVVVYLAASESAAETAKNTFLALLGPTLRVSVTVPGGTARPSCKLKRGGAKTLGWFTMNSRHGLILQLNLRQLGLS